MPGCTPGEAECTLKARSVVNSWLLLRILNLGLPPVPSTRAPANPWANLLRAALGRPLPMLPIPLSYSFHPGLGENPGAAFSAFENEVKIINIGPLLDPHFSQSICETKINEGNSPRSVLGLGMFEGWLQG